MDGNVTTSRGLGTAIDFSLSLIRQLEGRAKAEEIAESVVYSTEIFLLKKELFLRLRRKTRRAALLLNGIFTENRGFTAV